MPGRSRAGIQAPGYEGTSAEILAKPGQTVDLGTIWLFRAVTVAGRALFADGTSGVVTLEYHRLPGPNEDPRIDTSYRLQTKEDGTFELTDLGASIYEFGTPGDRGRRGMSKMLQPTRVDASKGDVRDVIVNVVGSK